uniref:Putative secreted peptide n=1 Tax=Anopheles braziliensis TaxID=58242 RepID=A0A2M3ZRI4_9DIPT
MSFLGLIIWGRSLLPLLVLPTATHCRSSSVHHSTSSSNKKSVFALLAAILLLAFVLCKGCPGKPARANRLKLILLPEWVIYSKWLFKNIFSPIHPTLTVRKTPAHGIKGIYFYRPSFSPPFSTPPQYAPLPTRSHCLSRSARMSSPARCFHIIPSQLPVLFIQFDSGTKSKRSLLVEPGKEMVYENPPTHTHAAIS